MPTLTQLDEYYASKNSPRSIAALLLVSQPFQRQGTGTNFKKCLEVKQSVSKSLNTFIHTQRDDGKTKE